MRPYSRLPPLQQEELTEEVARAAAHAADESRHIQNRLARSFEYYFRKRRPSAGGAAVLWLQAVTFSDGERDYHIRHTEMGWILEMGGARRGAHGLSAHERARIPLVYGAVRRGLEKLHAQLQQNPMQPATAVRAANRQLSGLLADLPAPLAHLRVVVQDADNVLAVHHGGRPRVLSQSPGTISSPLHWTTFCNGEFPVSGTATELTAVLFQTSISTVQKALARHRRKSRSTVLPPL
jgi:hypothetical protein